MGWGCSEDEGCGLGAHGEVRGEVRAWVEPEGDGDHDVETCKEVLREYIDKAHRSETNVQTRITPSSQLDLPSATTYPIVCTEMYNT